MKLSKLAFNISNLHKGSVDPRQMLHAKDVFEKTIINNE